MDIAIVPGSRPHLLTSKKPFTDSRNCGKLVSTRKCFEIWRFLDFVLKIMGGAFGAFIWDNTVVICNKAMHCHEKKCVNLNYNIPRDVAKTYHTQFYYILY